MKVTPLDSDLDGVVIIDGLSAKERSCFQDSVKLTKAIRDIEPRYMGPQYQCANEYEYYDALADLTSRANSGSAYFIHYECHGAPDGIKMGADIIKWQAQVDSLVQLNNAMHGQLVIDMMACNGIYASKMAGLSTHPAPFYAIIGPAKRVGMQCASIISTAFYRTYLTSETGLLDVAIEKANTTLGLHVILGIRSEAFARLQAQGDPFRQNATDSSVVDCRRNGTLFIS